MLKQLEVFSFPVVASASCPMEQFNLQPMNHLLLAPNYLCQSIQTDAGENVSLYELDHTAVLLPWVISSLRGSAMTALSSVRQTSADKRPLLRCVIKCDASVA